MKKGRKDKRCDDDCGGTRQRRGRSGVGEGKYVNFAGNGREKKTYMGIEICKICQGDLFSFGFSGSGITAPGALTLGAIGRKHARFETKELGVFAQFLAALNRR